MNITTNYSGQNLRGRRFQNQRLDHADFSGADLRGANFSFAHLHGARFTGVKTGINSFAKVLLFLLSLALSLLSGYIAMLAGRTTQVLLKSGEWLLMVGGYITAGFFLIFTIVAVWKGLFHTINKLLVGMIALALGMGLFMYLTGFGTGRAALYGTLALLLMVLMFIVGTIARATIGSVGSNVLFLVVALAGGVFGKSLGGGIATIIMAISCAVISKRALNDIVGDSVLKKIALRISSSFGTSFQHADLTDADFSDAELRNTNFSHARLHGVNWDRARQVSVLAERDT
jgi:hypothetical protein